MLFNPYHYHFTKTNGLRMPMSSLLFMLSILNSIKDMNICQWYIKKLGASWKEMVLESCVVDPQYEFGEVGN